LRYGFRRTPRPGYFVRLARPGCGRSPRSGQGDFRARIWQERVRKAHGVLAHVQRDTRLPVDAEPSPPWIAGASAASNLWPRSSMARPASPRPARKMAKPAILVEDKDAGIIISEPIADSGSTVLLKQTCGLKNRGCPRAPPLPAGTQTGPCAPRRGASSEPIISRNWAVIALKVVASVPISSAVSTCAWMERSPPVHLLSGIGQIDDRAG